MMCWAPVQGPTLYQSVDVGLFYQTAAYAAASSNSHRSLHAVKVYSWQRFSGTLRSHDKSIQLNTVRLRPR